MQLFDGSASNASQLPPIGARCAILAGGAAIFYLFYGGADAIARHGRFARHEIPFEPEWPFAPQLSLVYLSVMLALGALPFALREAKHLRRAAAILALELVTASALFLIVPLQPPQAPHAVSGTWHLPFAFLDALNLEGNCFPSLHVAFACTSARILTARRGPVVRSIGGAWAGTVALSTVVLRQHYAIDAIGGVALALAAERFIDRRACTLGADERER